MTTSGNDNFYTPSSSQSSSDNDEMLKIPRPSYLSMLNVVVDYVMMPPCPMEPSDFLAKDDNRQEAAVVAAADRTVQSAEEGTGGDGASSSTTTSSFGPISENARIRVPVIRIFGPVVKCGGDGRSDDCETFTQCSSNDGNDVGNARISPRTKNGIRQPQSGCLHVHGAYPYLLARPVIAGPDGAMFRSTSSSSSSSSSSSGRMDWDDVQSVSNVLDEMHSRLELTLRASHEHSVGIRNQRQREGPQMPPFVRRVTIVLGRGFYTYCSGPPAPFLRIEYYDPSMRWRVKMILERGIELNECYHPDPRQYDYNEDDSIIDTDIYYDGGDDDVYPLKFRCYEAHIPYTMQFFKDYNLAGMKYIKVKEVRFRTPLPRSLRKRTKEEFDISNNNNNNQHDVSGGTVNGDTKVNNDDSYFFAHTVPKELVWPQSSLDSSTTNQEDTNTTTTTRLKDEHWLIKETCCDLEFDCTVQHLLNVLDVMTTLPSPLEERQKIHWRAVPSLREIWEQERKRMSLLLPPEDDFLSCVEKEDDGTESSEGSYDDDDDDDDDDDNNNENATKTHTPQFTLNVKKGSSVPGTRLAIKGMKSLFGTSVGLEADFHRALTDIVSRHEKYIDDADRRGKNGVCVQQTYASTCIINNAVKDCELTPDLDEGIEALAALGNQFSQGSAVVDSDDDPIASSLNTINTHSQKDNEMSYNTIPLTQKDVEEEIERLTSGEKDGDASEEYDEDEEFLVEEERLGEAGFEKALTQLATQTMESSMKSAVVNSNDDEDLDLTKFYALSHVDDDESELFSDVDDCDDSQHAESSNNFSDSRSDTEDRFRLTNLSQPSDESTPKPSVSSSSSPRTAMFEEYDPTAESLSQDSRGGFSQKHDILELPDKDFFVEPDQSSTLRCGDITKLIKPLYSLSSFNNEICVPWFAYQWNSPGAPPTISNSYLEPVQRPPSYSQIKVWVRDQRKRTPSPNAMNNISKQQKSVFTQSPNDGSFLTAYTQFSQLEGSSDGTPDPLAGIGQQGGLVQISAGGGLKTEINTSTTFTPLTIMSIEIHVQCRIITKDQKDIAMVPDSSRDAVFAVVYAYCRDPGGGESLEILDKGCVLVTIEPKGSLPCSALLINNTRAMMGVSSDTSVEVVKAEANLLLRVASIVKQKDPDVLVSWDTQGGGLGYLVERGVALSTPSSNKIDMARLLGRTPRVIASDVTARDSSKFNSFGGIESGQQDQHQNDEGQRWSGSGLGAEWDDMVGSGAAASSIVGRIVICGWKICSEEVKHANASYQPAIVSAVLGKRIPFHDDVLLTKWYSANNGLDRWRVVEYRLSQAMSTVLLLDALDVLGRAGEAARLSGVEFSQSLPGIRGSQYKVEGVLLRSLQSVHSTERGSKKGVNKDAQVGTSLTSGNESQSQSQSPWKLQRSILQNGATPSVDLKDMGYFFYSPSKHDTSNQEALECQAMTMEPKSGFHFDPVIVCDFTALYPSLVIAYNLCYSTVAGKLDYHSTRQEMRSSGRTTSKIGPFFYSERRSAAVVQYHLKSLLASRDSKVKTPRSKRDRAYVIPTGSLFVAESVLKGVLPQVLDEMLSTRAMLKKAAKEYKKRVKNLSPAVLRQIEARQLALKYVANVTYGYTSATFSGRSAIPLVADAIVECGRRTLTNAIDLANKWGREKNGRWAGAHVLYGDTDSLFIKLPSRSVQEAFLFGEEFCKAVTASNPPPVALKLEKVYSSCLLQTKKKYCGMKYDSPSQKHPTFEAKGIETVRRDQCAVTQRILKTALIHAFQRGIIPVKEYLHRQWSMIHSGRLPVSDFVLTGRVRSRYRGGKIGPVQASLARRLAEIDPGRAVRHKERLPYVIVAMPGKSFKLKDGVYTPWELLEQWDSFSVNTEYYTVRHVNAALQRCFGLPPFNINIHAWYDSCPKPRRRIHHWPQSRSSSSLMISSYFGSDTCAFCSSKCKSVGSSKVVVCQRCKTDGISAACTAINKLKMIQHEASQLAASCAACNGCQESSGTFAQEYIPPISITSTKRRDNFSFGVTNPTQRKGRLVTPMANCVCIDCPITYQRHRIRESEIEANELCHALDLY